MTRLTSVVLGLVVAAALTTAARAEQPRQYYGEWKPAPSKAYYYKPYYYKPTKCYEGYKVQYCVYYPEKPKHVYMYDPAKKCYWGRYGAYQASKPSWQVLPESHQKPTIAAVPESAFPPPAGLPTIPGADDGARMAAPPNDLPPVEAPPAPGSLPGDN